MITKSLTKTQGLSELKSLLKKGTLNLSVSAFINNIIS